tara:strand:- start:42184 stop:42975 length:792 start_codon:yes stop_codon:yes gene_type:complete
MMTCGSLRQTSKRSWRHFGLAVALLCLVSCGDLSVTSVAPAEPNVPVAAKGEWQGTWVSDESGQSGELVLRIQEFHDEAVVALAINNGCLQQQNYELVVIGESVTLQVGGVPILVAEFAPSGQLVGSFDCPEDSGTWSATRIGPLPEPIDLSGTWLGSAMVAGESENPLLLELDQFVRDGRLVLEGFADVPGLVPVQVPLAGYVNFRETDFDLVLQTVEGFEPVMVFAGIGNHDPVRVDVGLIQVLSSQSVEFTQAVFQVLLQ